MTWQNVLAWMGMVVIAVLIFAAVGMAALLLAQEVTRLERRWSVFRRVLAADLANAPRGSAPGGRPLAADQGRAGCRHPGRPRPTEGVSRHAAGVHDVSLGRTLAVLGALVVAGIVVRLVVAVLADILPAPLWNGLGAGWTQLWNIIAPVSVSLAALGITAALVWIIVGRRR